MFEVILSQIRVHILNLVMGALIYVLANIMLEQINRFKKIFVLFGKKVASKEELLQE